MAFKTTDLCDEHGDLLQVATPRLTFFGASRTLAGEVVTVKCFEDNSKVVEQLDTPGKGRVLVVDGGASLRYSLLGGNLGVKAVKNGWAGVLVWGALRDVEELCDLPVGILALASVPRKTSKRGQGVCNVEVEVAGMRVAPGAFLYADENGVVLSPRDLLV